MFSRGLGYKYLAPPERNPSSGKSRTVEIFNTQVLSLDRRLKAVPLNAIDHIACWLTSS